MTPQERAAMLRVHAAAHDVSAARLRLTATVVTAGAALAAFGEAWQSSIDREVAEHPDLAELNVMLDGYYGPRST